MSRWAEAEANGEPMGRGTFSNALNRRGYPAAKASEGKRWRHGIALKKLADYEQ